MRPRSGQRQWRKRLHGRRLFARAAVASALMLLTGTRPVRAGDPIEPPQPQFGWREMWVGADATKDVWLLYSGVTLAPLSNDVYTDGIRLRMAGGYGRYSVENGGNSSQSCNSNAAAAKTCSKDKSKDDISFSYTDVLVGYHKRFGDLTAKAFIGASMADHAVSKKTSGGARAGREFGATGALEFWLNLGDNAWSSLDLSYSTAYETAAGRWRTGWRVLPTLSIGPELRFDRNAVEFSNGGTCKDIHPTYRGGLFGRYEWFGGEVSASAGFAHIVRPGGINGQGQRDCNDDQFEPYATVNFLTQY